MPRSTKNQEKPWLTTPEVAQLFEVTVPTIRAWIAKGELKAYKVNGYNRIDRSEVVRFAKERYNFDE